MAFAKWLPMATASVLLSILSAACAVGHVDLDGAIHGIAVGEGSKVEYCTPKGEAGFIKDAPEECRRIEGGDIVSGVIDIVGAVVKTGFTAVTTFLPKLFGFP